MGASETEARLRNMKSETIRAYSPAIKRDRMKWEPPNNIVMMGQSPTFEMRDSQIMIWACTDTVSIVCHTNREDVHHGWWLWTGCDADEVLQQLCHDLGVTS